MLSGRPHCGLDHIAARNVEVFENACDVRIDELKAHKVDWAEDLNQDTLAVPGYLHVGR